MPTSLNNADWVIDATTTYGAVATPSPESISGQSLSIDVGNAGAVTFTAILNKLRTTGGTLTFWSMVDRPVNAVGDVELNCEVKRTSNSTFSQDSHSFSTTNKAYNLSIANGFEYTLAASLTNRLHKILVAGNGSFSNSEYYYLTKSALYVDSGDVSFPGWTKFRVTYYDEGEFARIIVERLSGTDWFLVVELYDINNRETTNNNTPGYISFGTSSNSSTLADALLFSNIKLSDTISGASYISSGLISSDIGTSDNGNLVVSRSTSVTESIGSATGPDGSPANILTISNPTGSTEVVELFLPVYCFKNASLELYYKKTSPEVELYYNLRQDKMGASNFYNIGASITALGASSFTIGRVESGTDLIPIAAEITSGPTHTANVWVGHKISAYDTEDASGKRARIHFEYNIITGSVEYGQYSTLFDTIDNVVGLTTEPEDMTDKLGLYSVVIEIPAGDSIQVYGLNLSQL